MLTMKTVSHNLLTNNMISNYLKHYNLCRKYKAIEEKHNLLNRISFNKTMNRQDKYPNLYNNLSSHTANNIKLHCKTLSSKKKKKMKKTLKKPLLGVKPNQNNNALKQMLLNIIGLFHLLCTVIITKMH